MTFFWRQWAILYRILIHNKPQTTYQLTHFTNKSSITTTFLKDTTVPNCKTDLPSSPRHYNSQIIKTCFYPAVNGVI